MYFHYIGETEMSIAVFFTFHEMAWTQRLPNKLRKQGKTGISEDGSVMYVVHK